MTPTTWGDSMSEPVQFRPEWLQRRDQACASLGHPGATYNGWVDRTWCVCGANIYEGNRSSHVACCNGPLDPARFHRA